MSSTIAERKKLCDEGFKVGSTYSTYSYVNSNLASHGTRLINCNLIISNQRSAGNRPSLPTTSIPLDAIASTAMFTAGRRWWLYCIAKSYFILKSVGRGWGFSLEMPSLRPLSLLLIRVSGRALGEGWTSMLTCVKKMLGAPQALFVSGSLCGTQLWTQTGGVRPVPSSCRPWRTWGCG